MVWLKIRSNNNYSFKKLEFITAFAEQFATRNKSFIKKAFMELDKD